MPAVFADINPNRMFCVTLYNEPLQYLNRTISSVIKGSVLSRSESEGGVLESGHYAGRDLICLIADGLEQIDDHIFNWLKTLGIVIPQNLDMDNDALYMSSANLRYRHKLGVEYIEAVDQNSECEMQLLFCVKPKNRGKLDSHWWFFNKLCGHYQPDICFQIDVGTVLEGSTVGAMSDSLYQSSRRSAVASNVLIDPETNAPGYLRSFQCADFVIQRCVHWPAENVWGYISVIPGQCSAVYWPAMQGAADGATEHSQQMGPANRYLRGLHHESAFEEIMYLAEDRVLSFELIADRGSDNTINYNHLAVCYTDACDSVAELARQRRRWINSAFLCRTWAMANFGRYWRDSAASISSKLTVSGSLLTMGVLQCLDWFLPLIFGLVALAHVSGSLGLANHWFGVTTTATVFGYAFAVLTLALVALPSLLLTAGVFSKCSPRRVEFILGLAAAGTGAIVTTVVANEVFVGAGGSSSFYSVVFIVVMVVASVLSAKAIGPETYRVLKQTGVKYALVSLPMTLALNVYAFFHMSDNSWGTKGLARVKINHKNIAEKRRYRNLTRFALGFQCLWLSSNFAIFISALAFDLSFTLLTILLVTLMIYFLFGAAAAVRNHRSVNADSTLPEVSAATAIEPAAESSY